MIECNLWVPAIVRNDWNLFLRRVSSFHILQQSHSRSWWKLSLTVQIQIAVVVLLSGCPLSFEGSLLLPSAWLCHLLVIGDFAENYSFIIQDAAQSFHWNNLQATLHPFACKCNEEEFRTESNSHFHGQTYVLKHVSFLFRKATYSIQYLAVHLFQKVLINILVQRVSKLNKIIYCSSGCATQYKNRKKLCHFMPSQRGLRNATRMVFLCHITCDGVSGTVSHLAARASLHRPVDNQILTDTMIAIWIRTVRDNFINFYYAIAAEYEKEETLLRNRFESFRTIAGTH